MRWAIPIGTRRRTRPTGPSCRAGWRRAERPRRFPSGLLGLCFLGLRFLGLPQRRLLAGMLLLGQAPAPVADDELAVLVEARPRPRCRADGLEALMLQSGPDIGALPFGGPFDRL